MKSILFCVLLLITTCLSATLEDKNIRKKNILITLRDGGHGLDGSHSENNDNKEIAQLAKSETTKFNESVKELNADSNNKSEIGKPISKQNDTPVTQQPEIINTAEKKDAVHEKTNIPTSTSKQESNEAVPIKHETATTKDNKTPKLIPTTEKSDKASNDTKVENVPVKNGKNITDPKFQKDDTKNGTTTAKTETTSTAATTLKPTTEVVSDKTPATPLEARGFNGPSFVGGIIMTLGLMAIGFIGYKYYKNEGDYHTL